MTSFDSAPSLSMSRALLALAVVLLMLATTGWTAIHREPTDGASRDAALAAWERGGVAGRKLPDPEAPPRVIASFFATLVPAGRARLAERYPLVVGNLNGAPVALRYRANHIALEQARTMEKRRMRDRRLSPDGRHQASRRMHRFESLLEPGRQILAFDPGGDGRVAEVFGDLGRARRVSVIVPGVDTNVLTFERSRRKYTAPVGMAESLYAAERSASPGALPQGRIAVIAWADYTSPDGVGMDAAVGKLAEDGAVRLGALVGGLPGTAPVSLFCHSYGSVLCGVAARRLPPRVTDIAVAGSPGMRADSARGLRSTARVWAMRDADDWIQDVPYLEVGVFGHGADPVSSAFGARVLSSKGAIGHTGYFEPGTESLRNFAAIGVGAYDEVSCASGGTACRSGFSGPAELPRA
ncbi:alpha/beta hydrolase [Streptomyces sannanensis]|uniref:alpha/beta hydrolase n=1 Tax=Streptomyces sannanensis TaxID=285536 RepID=UPI0031E6A68B